MTNNMKGTKEYGPVFSCGAASVSFSHKDGEPTAFDRFFAAVKKLFNGGNRQENAVTGSADRGVAASYGAAR